MFIGRARGVADLGRWLHVSYALVLANALLSQLWRYHALRASFVTAGELSENVRIEE